MKEYQNIPEDELAAKNSPQEREILNQILTEKYVIHEQ